MRPYLFFVLRPLLFSLLPFAVTGCMLSPTAAPSPGAGLAMQGKVMGGQQPIAGAHVYLLAANTTGYAGAGIAASAGNASVSLLTNVPGSTTLDTSGGATNGDYYVTTGAGGTFTITGDYSCTPNTQVYLYALGGNPGLTSGTNNPASGLLAALGNCPGAGSFLTATPFIAMNEVSTVAAAYAFAGFATDATHVSSSGTALSQLGIANAFANAANLATLSTGVALAITPSGAVVGSHPQTVVPQSEINTLANILASCVNTNGALTGPANPSACYTLFNDAPSGGTSGTAPTDTATAAINIAHNPGANIAALYGIPTATPPFAPALSAQPNDFTIGIYFAGEDLYGGIYSPQAVAMDGSGSAWVTNQTGSTVTKLLSSGAVAPGAPFTDSTDVAPQGIAIDPSGNAWIAFSNGGSVVKLLNSGAPAAGSPFISNSLSGAYALAIDGSGDPWVTTYPETITKLLNTGAVAFGFPVSATGIDGAQGIAIDSSGNAWVASYYGGVVELHSGGTLGAGPFPATGSQYFNGIAIDASDRQRRDHRGRRADELGHRPAGVRHPHITRSVDRNPLRTVQPATFERGPRGRGPAAQQFGDAVTAQGGVSDPCSPGAIDCHPVRARYPIAGDRETRNGRAATGKLVDATHAIAVGRPNVANPQYDHRSRA
jgi:hypothetical protein